MCGLVGLASSNGPVEREWLESGTGRLAHRGPDHSGFYLGGGESLWVGLALQRLKIIDLSPAGDQPMPNETNDVWIAYNGELYNHLDLHQELESKGHVFRSRSDTEAIIHAYEEYGLEMLPRLAGMFAFALYDQPRQRLILARDRMGIKPLCYAWDGQVLRFASELKVFSQPGNERVINPQAVDLYLSFGFVPSPYSMFSGVTKLPAGHYLIFERGDISIHRYHKLTYHFPEGGSPATDSLVSSIRSSVEAAVQSHLMSDVPLGVFLSGGVDSTIVASLVKRHHDAPLETFSVGFANASGKLDERDKENFDLFYARRVAAELGSRHHEIIFTEQDRLAERLQEAVVYLEEPFREASFLSLHLMSRLAREHGVIVILTGDGGDELFAGYPWHLAALRLEKYEHIPGLRLLLPTLQRLAGKHELGEKARDLQLKLGQKDQVKYRLTHEVFSRDDKVPVLGSAMRDSQNEDAAELILHQVLERSGSHKYADNLALLDLALWVREHFNHRVDRMSMRNSVEARVPFQDNAVVELALSIPLRRKIQHGQGKALLRQAFADLLPEYVLNRPKRPFAVPDTDWLRGPLCSYLQENLLGGALYQQGILHKPGVAQLVTEFLAGNDRHAFKLWGLLVLHMWSREYL
jgi:asparagine synthase (glutamine-hydrolysing)